MGQKINAAAPEFLDIGGSWQVVWAAVDPTTGADVSGVTISNASVVADELKAATGIVAGPFMLVPGPGA